MSEASDKMKKFVVVWENRFLEQVKLCSERVPGKVKDCIDSVNIA